MEIENIRRWQWMIIGALVGLGFWNFWSDSDLSDVRQFSQQEFEDALARKDGRNNQPWITGIIVGPPAADFRTNIKLDEARKRESEAERSTGEQATALRAEAAKLRAEAEKIRVQVVRFKKLFVDPKDPKKFEYRPGQFIAQMPYSPTRSRGTPDPNATIATYLEEQIKRFPHVSYRTDWWTKGPTAMAVWMLAGVLLIGGIWPTLISLMVGAGFGPKREPKSKKKEGYFDRFSSAPEPGKVAASSVAPVSDADRKKLDDINRALELDLEEDGMKMTQSATASEELSKKSAAAIRKLDGGPVEQAAAQQQSAEDVEFSGEWYPVAHLKKHDAPAEDSDRK